VYGLLCFRQEAHLPMIVSQVGHRNWVYPGSTRCAPHDVQYFSAIVFAIGNQFCENII
jgi:DNA-binding FadR family transcriptional regulator